MGAQLQDESGCGGGSLGQRESRKYVPFRVKHGEGNCGGGVGLTIRLGFAENRLEALKLRFLLLNLLIWSRTANFCGSPV